MPGPHVCLVHRNRLLGECLAAALTESPGYECTVRQSSTFEESMLHGVAVDLLLLDASFEGELTYLLATRVRRTHPQCKVVLLVPDSALVSTIDIARICGQGCLFEGAGLADVRLAIEAVLAGQHYCSPHLANALFDQLNRRTRVGMLTNQKGYDTLTEREREILELIAQQQLGNKQIARCLGLSLHTVKNHVHNIIEKLGVRDRHGAAQHARRHTCHEQPGSRSVG